MRHRSWTVISQMASLAFMIWLGLGGSALAQSVSYQLQCRGFFNVDYRFANFANSQVVGAATNSGDLSLPTTPFFATRPGGATTFVPELLQGSLTFPGPLTENTTTSATALFNVNIGGIWLQKNTAAGTVFVHKVPGGYSFNLTYQTGPFFDLFGPATVTFNGVDVADAAAGGALTTLHFQQQGDDDSSGANINLTVPGVKHLYNSSGGVSSNSYGITTGTLECDGYLQ
jgi:hypothetical protein